MRAHVVVTAIAAFRDSTSSAAPAAAFVGSIELERAGDPSLDALVSGYLRAARAERTRIAYANDWRVFERWCAAAGARPLPASTATLARYLSHLAAIGKKASTIRRARIAIGMLHAQRGLPRPDRDDRIRVLERGIGRVHGNREEGATPLRLPELVSVVQAFGISVRDTRDRALLLLGFAGAFRASELVGLDRGDIEIDARGARIFLRRSKEDQLAHGALTHIPRARNEALCPVAALERWTARLPAAGPLFRVVYGARVSDKPLSPRAVSRALQRAAKRAQLPDDYSSHSRRAGFATSAHRQGQSCPDIQAHGRWKNPRSVFRYSMSRAKRRVGRSRRCSRRGRRAPHRACPDFTHFCDGRAQPAISTSVIR